MAVFVRVEAEVFNALMSLAAVHDTDLEAKAQITSEEIIGCAVWVKSDAEQAMEDIEFENEEEKTRAYENLMSDFESEYASDTMKDELLEFIYSYLEEDRQIEVVGEKGKDNAAE